MNDVTACTGDISGQEGPKRTQDLSGLHKHASGREPPTALSTPAVQCSVTDSERYISGWLGLCQIDIDSQS